MKRLKYIKKWKIYALSLTAVFAFSSITPVLAADTAEPPAAEEETSVTAAPYRLRTEQAKKGESNVINVWLELDPVNAESIASYQIALQLQNREGQAVSGRKMELKFDEALEGVKVKKAEFNEATQTMNIYVAGTENLVQIGNPEQNEMNKLPIGTLTVEEAAKEDNAFKVVVSEGDGDFIFVGVDRHMVDASEKYGDENTVFTIPSDGTIYGREAYFPLKIDSGDGGTVKAYLVKEDGTESLIKEGANVKTDQLVRLAATPDTGYKLTSLKLCLGEKTEDIDGDFTFYMTDAYTVQATFEKITDKYTVTVGEHGSIVGTREESAQFESRETVIVTAKAPEGKKFSHWVSVGAEGKELILSYDAKYSFVVLGNVTLKPVFVEDAAEVEKSTTVSLDGVTVAEFPSGSKKYRLSYTGGNFLADGCKIVERGIVLTNQTVTDENLDEFVIDGKINNVGVAKIKVSGTAKQFIVNVNNVKPGQTRTGRGYLIYKDATGQEQTVYGDTWVLGETPDA